ncbi:UNVERIFIED_ORG: hypothetical protein M2402_003833 [Rahnella aquatilis]
MHAWNKKFFVSKIALACAVAVTAPAAISADISGTVYDTFYHDSTLAGHIGYRGYVDNDGADNGYVGGDIYSSINNAVVNGVISTHYLGFDSNNSNTLNITNTTVNGMITSECMTSDCGTTRNEYDQSPLQLTIDNSTINDTYEHFDYDVTDANNVRDHETLNTFDKGVAVTLDQESDIVIKNNSHVAGIALTQGYEWVDTDVNNGNTFDNTLTVNDSVLTSGSYTELQTSGFYGQSDKPSDYGNISAAGTQADDIALSVVASATADNAMKTHAVFNNSTITGDVAFVSTFDENYYVGGHDSNADGVLDTNGWDDTDELNLTLDNGSKWVGAAISNVQMDSALYNRSTNSIWPYSVFSSTNGYLVGDDVYQSGLFNVALNNGSEWDTTKSSNIDDLTVNNRSQVNVVESALLADHISLTNASTLKIAAHGGVKTDVLNLNSGSQASLTEETASLYANTIIVGSGSELNLGLGQVDTHNMVLTDNGIFDIG